MSVHICVRNSKMKEKTIQTINELNREYRGPFYLFDIKRLFLWYEALEKKLKDELSEDASLVYAIKANAFLTKYMNEKVNSFEVCSPGEFEICMKYSIPTNKIVFSGVYKSKENIERIFEENFNGVITLESENHYKLLKQVINEKQIESVRILPRLSSGNKFGMDEESVISIIKDALSDKRIQIEGIQYFSGTQKKKIKVINEELKVIDSFCDRIHSETGLQIEFVEYGPGFFYDYYSLTDHMQVFDEVIGELKPYAKKYRFALEAGRFLAAGCGEYITKIVDIKKTFEKNYILVDGGIHHVNYYGRMLGMNVPSVDHVIITDDGARVGTMNSGEAYEITGALCTVSDVLLKNFSLNSPKEGDLLVFHDTGAYSPTESSVLFLSRTMPQVFALEVDGSCVMLRDAIESYELNS